MPQTVNGCGAWYYGKKNLHRYEGVCSACGQHAVLTSYDTRLFVVALFIPIIPLGRRHIIEECSACTKHGVLPLEEWNRAQRRIAEAIVAYRRSPADAALAKEALEACAGVRHSQAFSDLAPHVEQHLAGHADTMRLLAAVHSIFGRTADVERVLRMALAANDHEDMREALADCVMRQGRPDEAAPYIQHIIDKGMSDRVDLIYQLAQMYQLAGQHDKALTMFRHCETINPVVAGDETFARLRAASEQHQGRNVAIKPADVIRKANNRKAVQRFGRLAPLAAAVLLVAYLGVAWFMGTQHRVQMVNGTGQAYTVRINGIEHRLQPRQVWPVTLGEGEVSVQIVDSAMPIPPETITIRTPLFTRPFARPTLVINPDRTAILQETRFYYVRADRSDADLEPETTFAMGKTLHSFQKLDYVFTTPPDNVKMGSNSSRVAKRRLDLFSGHEHMSESFVLIAMADELGHDTAAEIARRRLLIEPQRTEFLGMLAHWSRGDELLTFLRQGCERRPLLIQWHRTYQQAMMQAGRQEEIEREYDRLLAAEPANKDLVYLAGRASQSPEREITLCRQAATGEAPSAYAIFALASYQLGVGEFADAARLATQALRLLPNEEDVRWYCKEALLADGQYRRLMDMAREQERQPLPAGLAAYRDLAYLYAIQGQRQEADNALAAFKDKLGRLFGPNEVESSGRRLQAEISYCAGALQAFSVAMLASTSADDRIAGHLTAGDLAAAERELKDASEKLFWPVLLYVSAASQGQRELAEKHLKACIEQLAQGDSTQRAYASALDGKPTIPLAELLRLRHQPGQKALLLTALGLRDPGSREVCFALARKLNYDRRFPHLLLKGIHESARH